MIIIITIYIYIYIYGRLFCAVSGRLFTDPLVRASASRASQRLSLVLVVRHFLLQEKL